MTSPLHRACEHRAARQEPFTASWHHSLNLEIVLQGFSPSHFPPSHGTFLHPALPTVSLLCLPSTASKYMKQHMESSSNTDTCKTLPQRGAELPLLALDHVCCDPRVCTAIAA